MLEPAISEMPQEETLEEENKRLRKLIASLRSQLNAAKRKLRAK